MNKLYSLVTLNIYINIKTAPFSLDEQKVKTLSFSVGNGNANTTCIEDSHLSF